MADRLTGMELFVRAIRLGSLSAAGRDMSMSPAMAARHLSMLERRLGVTLVNRTTRRLSLTQAGDAYLEKAERLLGELAEAEAEASAHTADVEGVLRITAPAAFGMLHLAGIVAAFRRQHPGVTVDLGLNDRFADLLEERWDVAIRIGQLADSGLVARRLAPVRLVVCAAPSYLEARGTPRTLADLRGHNCLGYTLSSSVGPSHWSFGRDGGTRVPIDGPWRADNGMLLMQAAVAGEGLVYGPRFFAARALADGGLVEIVLDAPLMDLGAIHAVTHPARLPAARTRAWIEFVAARIKSMARDW